MISLFYLTASQPDLCVDLMLRDGCWSKLQELYIDDSHDTSMNTLRECFTLGKGMCSDPLDKTLDQLLW
ncbi:hypothetical protein F2Q70_00036520 [Brassica cretica]|uniref:Uncharacterized protein n=1 Tax=Brassica cretica TaxID=69181 RepID=A0A8S9JZ19_BRACR|nr:hypothetical protein F2Q70_00036520 [Brassica cretica]